MCGFQGVRDRKPPTYGASSRLAAGSAGGAGGSSTGYGLGSGAGLPSAADPQAAQRVLRDRPGAGRPVGERHRPQPRLMFWIHGGGFTNGNGIEQDGYNGENFARFGDVVFCSINHRWVPWVLQSCRRRRREIRRVGKRWHAGHRGGPRVGSRQYREFRRRSGNVTIMGQSGGGAKVCTLTAMPSAKGLFHKAVVLSGASRRAGEKTYSEKLGAAVVKEAGLNTDDWTNSRPCRGKSSMPSPRAQQAMARKQGRRRNGARLQSRGGRQEFCPSIPTIPMAAPTAADVPMIISSVQNEQSPSWTDSSLEVGHARSGRRESSSTGQASAPASATKRREVVESYAKAFPGRKPVEIWSLVSSNRQSVVALADVKSKQPAPVFVDWFTWQPPLFDNRMRAFHCVDICFWFYNTDLMLTHTGGGPRPRALSTKWLAPCCSS